ncbi:PREDICTED: uncharacterized protein LOC105148720 [Acromyrmex echinatior]|uniref:uncharacterized protein LOC105148720 n=1 Tax=Acromyrmex echinatior TaxID=103372 RepID=UPI000580FE84|nr:PREDICTED: uncharacterized protein LOC105148720 [Acromyrmex echinatior]
MRSKNMKDLHAASEKVSISVKRVLPFRGSCEKTISVKKPLNNGRRRRSPRDEWKSYFRFQPCGYIRARASGGTAKRKYFKKRVIYIRDPSVLDGDFMCLSGNGRYEAINFKNPDYPSAGLPLYCEM